MILSVLLLAATNCWCQLTGKVVGIQDGDTFTLLTASNEQFRIRIHGIDCPEKNQPYGQVAKQFASDQLFGKMVSVKQTDIDRYKRIVAIVTYDEIKIYNTEILKAGLAWHYKKYDQNPAWAKLEQEARAAKKGLWKDANPIAPWEWRK